MQQIVRQCVSSLRESILKTAKALVEDTKLLVAGAASTQEKLAQAAHSSAKTITQLTEVVKLGATSMGSENPETQVITFTWFFWVCPSVADLSDIKSKKKKKNLFHYYSIISLFHSKQIIFSCPVSPLVSLIPWSACICILFNIKCEGSWKLAMIRAKSSLLDKTDKPVPLVL